MATATDQITLPADVDRPIGSRPARRLRREGRIPGVVYGAGEQPTPVAVAWSDLRAALTTPAGMNALITIELGGTEHLTIVKDLQRHPVRREITHVDFVIIDRNVAIDVEVPILLEGTEGDHLKGLIVDQQLFTLPVAAKPGSIPNEFVVDCGPLSIEDPIRAGDIALPAGVELTVDPDEAVVSALVPQVELPEPAEGEEAEGDAPAGPAPAAEDAESGGEAAEAPADEG